MKLVSYLKEDHAQLAILVNGYLFDTDNLHPNLPVTMTMFLNYWEDSFPIAHSINRTLEEGTKRYRAIPADEAEIIAPVPSPTSCRDAYAFRQHVASARRNRKVEMILEFDQFLLIVIEVLYVKITQCHKSCGIELQALLKVTHIGNDFCIFGFEQSEKSPYFHG